MITKQHQSLEKVLLSDSDEIIFLLKRKQEHSPNEEVPPMITTTHPTQMTDDERLTEVAHILATAIRRLLEKQKTEKIPVDNSPNQCPYGRKTTKGERR